jgi:hypothetical protein
VSLSNFTPKPQTPFEDAPLLTEESLRERGRLVSDSLSKIGDVETRLDPPKATIIQALLARGGAEASHLVLAQLAARGKSGQALKAIGYNSGHPIHRPWARADKPWRIINCQVGTDFLTGQAHQAELAEPSTPCPSELGCGRCLACARLK